MLVVRRMSLLMVAVMIAALMAVLPVNPAAAQAAPVDGGLTLLDEPCVVYDSTLATGAGISGSFAAGESRTIQVTLTLNGQGGSSNCLISTTATAVVYTISAINPQGLGNLRLSPQGVAANGGVVNYQANGLNNANTVTVPIDTNGLVDIVANAAATDVRLVALGFYSPQGTLQYNPITPCAVADSRSAQGPTGDFVGPFASATSFPDVDVTDPFPAGQGGGNTSCGIPVDAEAVMANVVAIRPAGATGFGGQGALAPRTPPPAVSKPGTSTAKTSTAKH